MSQHENGLLAITGNQTRLGNHYCQSVKGDGGLPTRVTLTDVESKAQNVERYRILNLKNLLTPKQTVEFRVFAGTTSGAHAIGYVLVAMGLCHRAACTPAGPKFDSTTSTPDYITATEDLIKRLKWHTAQRFGVPAGGKALMHAGCIALRAAAQRFAN